jgi:hypothetical protein
MILDMKHFLLPFFCLIFSLSALPVKAQVYTDSNSTTIDLRYDSQDIEQGQNFLKRGTTNLMVGLALSAVGTGLAILAPDLVKEPTPIMTFSEYQEQLRLAGTNTSAQEVVHQRYEASMTDYEDSLAEMENKINTFRYIGVGAVSVGLVFNLTGIHSLRVAFK